MSANEARHPGDLVNQAPIEASVIVTMYNAAEHIEEQLLALTRQQTDVAWELILADNGCTDDTLAIVERVRYAFRVPVRVVDASSRRGQAAAWNVAVAHAAGELLLFADADDVVDEHWVHELAGAVRAHTFVGGRLELTELNSEEVLGWRSPLAQDGLPRADTRPYVVGANFGITAAAYAAVGGMVDDLIGVGGDFDISMKMYAQEMPAVFADRAVVHYRYRREPREAIRQMWVYGTGKARASDDHGVPAPAFVDVMVVCIRSAKTALKDLARGRRPVRQAADVAYVLGETSRLWRRPAFWRLKPNREVVQNPVPVQLDRVRRVWRRIGRHRPARRASP